MTLNWTYTRILTATAVATSVMLCPVIVSAQTGNQWNPYPVQQAQPASPPAPVAKPTYYQEAAPTAQAPDPSARPSRFAPADLDQRLSAPAMSPYTNSPPNSSSNSPAYFGQPQGYANGYPQGYNPMNAPPNNRGNLGGYGGYGPPIIGNNGWGSAPGNNFFPFGF